MSTHHKNYKKSTKSLAKRKSRITKKTKKSKKIKSRRHRGKNLTSKQLLEKMRLQKGGRRPMPQGVYPLEHIIPASQLIYDGNIRQGGAISQIRNQIKGAMVGVVNKENIHVDIQLGGVGQMFNLLKVEYIHNGNPLPDHTVAEAHNDIKVFLEQNNMIVDMGAH